MSAELPSECAARDPEDCLSAISTVAHALTPLSRKARRRVIAWATDRFVNHDEPTYAYAPDPGSAKQHADLVHAIWPGLAPPAEEERANTPAEPPDERRVRGAWSGCVCGAAERYVKRGETEPPCSCSANFSAGPPVPVSSPVSPEERDEGCEVCGVGPGRDCEMPCVAGPPCPDPSIVWGGASPVVRDAYRAGFADATRTPQAPPVGEWTDEEVQRALDLVPAVACRGTDMVRPIMDLALALRPNRPEVGGVVPDTFEAYGGTTVRVTQTEPGESWLHLSRGERGVLAGLNDDDVARLVAALGGGGAKPELTDEMVERAAKAAFSSPGAFSWGNPRACARVALLATEAFSTPSGEGEQA